MRGRGRGGFGPPKAARPVKLNSTWGKPKASVSTGGRAAEPAYGPEWAATRAFVLNRDNYTCTNRQCRVVHRPPNHGKLDAHHIRPREKGGPDTPDNLRTLCKSCHALEHAHLQKMGYGQPRKP